MYIRSRYLRIHEKGSGVAVYHALHPDPVILDRETWKEITHDSSSSRTAVAREVLRSRGVLIASPEEDDATYEDAKARFSWKLDRTTILYLVLAQGCNLGCAYCPIPEIAARRGETLLPPEDATRGVDIWLSHTRDLDPNEPCAVIFYGGEPLLNRRAFESTLEHLQRRRSAGKLPALTDLLLATNGVLIDAGIAKLCRSHGVIVVVGFDGDQASHDRLRTYPDGRGSFDESVAAIRKLVGAGVRTCASVAVTPSNISCLEGISRTLEELGVEKFGFNFIRGKKLFDLVPRDETLAYYRTASRAIIASQRTHGREGFEYQLEKKSNALLRGDLFPPDCTCYGNQLVVRPDGRLSHCPFSDISFGHVREANPDFRVFETETVREWRKTLPLFHPAYDDCDAVALSGGGCRWGWDEMYGEGTPDLGMKIFAEEVLYEFLDRKLEGL